jgi:DivIVA domain-containing protein
VELDIQDFRRARPGTEGYARDEVDRFVAEVREALRHRPPTMAPWEVRDKVFTTQRVHRGYHEHDVDDFLDRAELALRGAHEAGLADPHAEVQQRRTHPLTVVALLLSVVVSLALAAAVLLILV